MLYLAEVKKKTKNFISGTKTVLTLLACQQNDNRWSLVPGEETITTEEVGDQIGEGAIVTVNLGANRQLQGQVELAGSKIANWLQTFSRQLEKSKEQEEEIEQWKQSLTYQAQELTRRQNELEETEQQLAEKEEELNQVEEQKQELEQLREQYERDRAELEGAWEQLRGEQQRLEQQQQELEGKQGLNTEQKQSLQTLVEQVETAINSAGNTLEPIHSVQQLVNERTETLQGERNTLEQQRQQAQEKQQEAEQLSEQLKTLRQQLRTQQEELLETQNQVATAQSQLEMKQQVALYIGMQLQKQSELRDVVSRLVINSPQLKIQQVVDTETLENMPIEELEEEFNKMQQSLDDAVSFVKDQEEELDYQLQSVRDLEEQLNQASESEKDNIQNELSEEQDRFRFLEKTLVGQRRNLMAREDIFKQYQRILKRRKGEAESEAEMDRVDLSPVFNKIDHQRDYSEDEFHQVNNEIEDLKRQIEELQNTVEKQREEVEKRQEEVQEAETNWKATQELATNLSTRVEVIDENLTQREQTLQQIRDQLNGVTSSLETLNSEEQRQQLSEVKELLNNL